MSIFVVDRIRHGWMDCVVQEVALDRNTMLSLNYHRFMYLIVTGKIRDLNVDVGQIF